MLLIAFLALSSPGEAITQASTLSTPRELNRAERIEILTKNAPWVIPTRKAGFAIIAISEAAFVAGFLCSFFDAFAAGFDDPRYGGSRNNSLGATGAALLSVSGALLIAGTGMVAGAFVHEKRTVQMAVGPGGLGVSGQF